MHQYIIRRLLFFLPSLLGVSIVIFVVMRIVPGDVAMAILAGQSGGGEAAFTAEELAALRHKLGTDRPIYIQYADWIWQLLHGDFGTSLWTDEPIVDVLRERFPMTLELALLSMAVSMSIALPIGVLSALKQDQWPDYVLRVFSIGGVTVPTFWVGIMVIYFLVAFFNWMPPLGFAGLLDDPGKNLQQLIWPALAQGYWMTGVVSRMTRSCMLEVLREDYIRTAWAKGLREQAIVYRHALKNAVLPVITLLGYQFGRLLGGTVIMEVVFSLPGMGRNLVEAIYHRDYPMIQAIVLIIAVLFLSINLLVDVLYGWLDPRIRYQ